MATVEQIAKIFQRNPRQIQRWVREGILPRPSGRGQYDVTACVRAFIADAHRKLEAMGIDPQEGESVVTLRALQEERARLTRAKRNRVELELARSRGELVPISEYADQLCRLHMAFRQRALGLDRLAPQLEGEPTVRIKQRLVLAIERVMNSCKGILREPVSRGGTEALGHEAAKFGEGQVAHLQD